MLFLFETVTFASVFILNFNRIYFRMAGLYLHIPFCKQRCVYCDFYSTLREAECSVYVEALCDEMRFRNSYLKGELIRTIYLGGGTPSLLQEEHLVRLSETWSDCFKLSSDAEITLEVNPDDLSLEYLQMLRNLSFNRISMGIQSFKDETLRTLNRRHSVQQALRAVELCREAGFGNLSLDLIYGLPGEGLEQWKENVEQAVALRPEHLSAYLLTYEEGTRLYTLRAEGKVGEMPEEESFECYRFLVERLKRAGYVHYEISNFALPGYYSRHNSSYWKGVPYLGCGPSAHSYDGDSRQWNTSSLTRYMKGIRNKEPFYEKEVLDLYTRYNEYIVTRLRTMWGISLEELESLFGKELSEYMLANANSWIKSGKMIFREGILCLTEQGVFVSDAIMSDLIFVED